MTDFAVSFATPKAGWMQIDIRFGDYDGPGYASSDVRNDPYREFQEARIALDGPGFYEHSILLWGEPEETFIKFAACEGSPDVRISIIDDFDILVIAHTLPRKKVAEEIQRAIDLISSKVVREHWGR